MPPSDDRRARLEGLLEMHLDINRRIAEKSERPMTDSKQPHVLIADDEDMLRNSLCAQLEDAGYQVSTAASGEEAIRLVGEVGSSIDLAILDVKMPKVSGFEVLKFIKERFPAIKAIMLTGYADLAHATESKRRGAIDFLAKPFEIEDLLITVKRNLEK